MKSRMTRYYRARAEAQEHCPFYSNRARAAEDIYCSKEALADYETGESIPPCDVVHRMVEVYGTPDLGREHIKEFCPLMCDLVSERGSELQAAALGWTVELGGQLQEVLQAFAALARDGDIDGSEVPAAMMVRERATTIAQVMHDTITAIDKGLYRHGKGGKI